MSRRYTHKDAENCARRLAVLLGLDFQDDEWSKVHKDDWQSAQHGTLRLDCNSHYGGCRVERISLTGSGISWNTERQPPRQFCESVWFTEKLFELYDKIQREVSKDEPFGLAHLFG